MSTDPADSGLPERLRVLVQSYIEANWRTAYKQLLRDCDIPSGVRPWPKVIPLLESEREQRNDSLGWRYRLMDRESQLPQISSTNGEYRYSFRVCLWGREIELFQTTIISGRWELGGWASFVRDEAPLVVATLMLRENLAMNAYFLVDEHTVGLALTYDRSVSALVSKSFLDHHWFRMRELGLGECRIVYNARTGAVGPHCRWKDYDFWVPLGMWVLTMDREIDLLWLTRPDYTNGSLFDCRNENLSLCASVIDQSCRWKFVETKKRVRRLRYKSGNIERWATVSGPKARSHTDAWCHIVSRLPADHMPLNAVRGEIVHS